MTVPPEEVARIAPPSQPGTSTQTTVMSAVPPAADTTASRVAIGSRASATTTSSARPESRSRAASASWGTMPTVRRAPASPGGRQAQRAGLAGAADDRDHRLLVAAPRRGASVREHRRRPSPRGSARRAGRRGSAPRSSGRRARRSRRTAPARTCPSQRARPSSITSGVSVRRHQGGDPVPHREARAGDSGPTSSTVPTSMPPDPVSGFCILPRVGHDVEHLGADGRPVLAVRALELAERRGVEVQPLDPDPDLVGPELAAGVQAVAPPAAGPPAGPGPGATRSDRWRARSFSSVTCDLEQDDLRRGFGQPADRPPTVSQ